MQQAFDQTSIRLTLLKAVQNGRFTIDALDQASGGFHQNTKVHPQFFKNGYQGVQHRNLLREDGVAPEAVQVTSERDLPPLPHGVTHAHADGPLTLEQEPETPFVPF